MSKTLLSAEEFSRAVAARAKEAWPDIRVRAMGRLLLQVEPRLGTPLVLSLADVYQTYCDFPVGKEAVIRTFLCTALGHVGAEPGDLQTCREKLLPQIVPIELLTRAPDLVAIPYVGDLAVAFVLDEPERYAYIHRHALEQWELTEPSLLATSVGNLQRLRQEGPGCTRIGRGVRTMLSWETFDGYDASRVLLTSELEMMALEVPGSPVIAMPHRDYLVVFGDSDGDFVQEMTERIRHEYTVHSYRISPRLYTVAHGQLTPYTDTGARERIVN